MRVRPFKNWAEFLDYIRPQNRRVYYEASGCVVHEVLVGVRAQALDGDVIEVHAKKNEFSPLRVGRESLLRFRRPGGR